MDTLILMTMDNDRSKFCSTDNAMKKEKGDYMVHLELRYEPFEIVHVHPASRLLEEKNESSR